MSLPTGTALAEEIKLRKSCRGCKQPLYDNGQDEHFPVAGIGVMHRKCAIQYCSEQGIELDEAVPICKHWRLKGHCIYQDKCMNRHPPSARGVGKRAEAQFLPNKDRAAAWRAHNAAMQDQHTASAGKQPAFLKASNGQLDPQPCSSHASQPAADKLETSRMSSQSLLDQPSNTAHASLLRLSVPQPDSSSSTPKVACVSVLDIEQIQVKAEEQDSLHEYASFASASARRKPSYARLGPAGLNPRQSASLACGADSDSTGLRRFKIRNRFRAGVFRRFLIDTFGREALAGGSGVLDIAGGRGELSFELLNLNKIRATIIDPRPGSLSKQAKWLKTGFFHRNAIYQAYVDRPLSDFAMMEPEMPRSVRLVLSAELCASLAAHGPAGAADLELPLLLEQAFDDALSDRWIHQGADHEGSGPSRAASRAHESARAHGLAFSVRSGPQSAQGYSTSTAHSVARDELPRQLSHLCSDQEAPGKIITPAEAIGQAPAEVPMQSSMQPEVHLQSVSAAGHEHTEGPNSTAGVATETLPEAGSRSRGLDKGLVTETCSLFQDASVLVGMHPDQATEHIVGLAQQLRKPFAVVPCCVHARDFPQRKLTGGAGVRSHEDLIAYIVSKDPLAIQVTELPFEGRNIVVYCRQWSHKA